MWMSLPTFARHGRRAARPAAGFTVLELLVAMVVVAILLAVALPSFLGSQRKSRRTDAINALSFAQAQQERYRANNPSYATSSALPLSSSTASGYYTVAMSDDSVSATGYTITATAVSGSSQASDAGCQMLAVRMSGGNLSYGSGSSSIDWTDAAKCWAR